MPIMYDYQNKRLIESDNMSGKKQAKPKKEYVKPDIQEKGSLGEKLDTFEINL